MEIILITSILIGLIFAPLGCFVLWKKYVYYSDGLAHASILAAAISIILDLPVIYAALFNTIIFAIIVFKLKANTSNNAAVGLTSSVMMSFALVLSYMSEKEFNFSSLLFGDIIAANIEDIKLLIFILLSVICFFVLNFKNLLLIILSRDVAHSRNINIQFTEFLFLSILSFAIISTIKIVGALLVTSIILIPALCARLVSNSPATMILFAAIIAQIMNLTGFVISYHIDIPFSPIIVLCGGMIYIIMFLIKYLKSK